MDSAASNTCVTDVMWSWLTDTSFSMTSNWRVTSRSCLSWVTEILRESLPTGTMLHWDEIADVGDDVCYDLFRNSLSSSSWISEECSFRLLLTVLFSTLTMNITDNKEEVIECYRYLVDIQVSSYHNLIWNRFQIELNSFISFRNNLFFFCDSR